MKYCPYCGAGPVDGEYAFCLECGKPIPVVQKQGLPAVKKTREESDGKKKRKMGKEKEKPKITEEAELLEDDGYDGYYDDIQPVDAGKIRLGIDKEMIKRIVGLLAGVLIVICACVAIMYLL